MRALRFCWVAAAMLAACEVAEPPFWELDSEGGGGTNGTDGAGGALGMGGGGDGDGDGLGFPGGVELPCASNGGVGECLPFDVCTGDDRAPVAGYCPGPADIQCCVEQIPGVCDPEATPLPNVDIVEVAGTGGCPDGMQPVDTFCVDTFEAALVRYPDLGPVSPYVNPGAEEIIAVSAASLVPQGYINELQASDACLNAGKRLCSNTEWLRACRGPDDLVYPYGDQREPGVCNDARSQHPAVEYFMTSDPWIYSELGHPCLNQLDDGLGKTGAHDGCVTAEGAFDMMGNLHEWTDDPNGSFRGGFYVDTALNGEGCLYVTTAHDVSHWDYSTGFRCCADP